MADAISFDFSEVEKMAVNLGRASAAALPAARAVIAKGALNIKTTTRENVSDHPTWKRLAATVNYSLAGNAFYSEAEVGYDDVGQGELAGIYEFGSAYHPPHPTLIPAAKAEEPRFEAAMVAALVKATEQEL